MKPFKIEKNSWHFILATKYGYLDSCEFDKQYPEDNPDFCKYVRSVFAGSMLVTAITAMLSAVIFLLVLLPIMNILVYLEYGYLQDPEFVALIGVIIVSFFGASVWFNEDAIQNRRNKRYQKYLQEKKGELPEPSFTQLLYKKFKEKTCFKIEVV